MHKSKNKIKDEALKQLFKLKVEQLNEVRLSKTFTHPIAFETIWYFAHDFERFYTDERMLRIIHDTYAEIETVKSRLQLLEGMQKWADDKGYDHDLVFK